MSDNYYKSRYVWNDDRKVVWKEIVRFLEKYIPKDGTVLDIGAGYCDFINNVNAKNKIALDYSPDLQKYAGAGVVQINSSVTDMGKVESNTVDVVFASNLFEHLTDSELETTMNEVKRVLKKDNRKLYFQMTCSICY